MYVYSMFLMYVYSHSSSICMYVCMYVCTYVFRIASMLKCIPYQYDMKCMCEYFKVYGNDRSGWRDE